LECLGSVAKAKRHAHEFERAERCDDRGFRNVFFCHRDLIKGFDQVDRAKDGTTVEVEAKIVQVWDWVAVWFGSRVERTVVTTWSPVPVGFACHVQRGSILAGGRANDTLCKHADELGIDGLT